MVKATGRPKGRYKKGEIAAAVRTSHLGFDCYKRGPITSQYIRVVKVEKRLAPWIVDPIRSRLPYEFMWPEASHSDAHKAIDALLATDILQMEEWERQWVGFRFGWDDYRDWLRQYLSVGNAPTEVPTEVELSVPKGRPIKSEKITSCRWSGVRFTFNVVRFKVGSELDAWGEILIHTSTTILTRILVDLPTNKKVVTMHYPGKYSAMGIRMGRLKGLLGSDCPDLSKTIAPA